MSTSKRPFKKPSEEQLVTDWNKLYEVGQPVRYWTGVIEGEGKTSVTRSEAELLGGHIAVVWVEGEPDCIALTHIRT